MADITLADLKEHIDRRFVAIESRMATKDDLARIHDVMATKDDLSKAVSRLERKILESRDINTKYHLTTRELIGDLNRQFNDMSDRLARAGDSLHGIS